MVSDQAIRQLHKRLDETPEEPGTPLIDLLRDRPKKPTKGQRRGIAQTKVEKQNPEARIGIIGSLGGSWRQSGDWQCPRCGCRDRITVDLEPVGCVDCLADGTIEPKKKTPRARRKGGRPRGSRNKNKSGSLSPVVETRKGKTYPPVEGKRVPKDLAFDHPHQFNWLYQYSDWCDRREKWVTRSKRVSPKRVQTVKYMICDRRPVAKILDFIKTGTLNERKLYHLYACRLRDDGEWEATGETMGITHSREIPADWQERVNDAGVWAIAVTVEGGKEMYQRTLKPERGELGTYKMLEYVKGGGPTGRVMLEIQAHNFGEVREQFQAAVDGSGMVGLVERAHRTVEVMRDAGENHG